MSETKENAWTLLFLLVIVYVVHFILNVTGALDFPVTSVSKVYTILSTGTFMLILMIYYTDITSIFINKDKL